MDDVISRTAAMTIPVLPKEHRDYISFELDDIYEQGWNECQSFIAKLPSAQTEIVRCKECKHRHLDGMIWDCPFCLTGGEDFFCAYGAKDGDSDDE